MGKGACPQTTCSASGSCLGGAAHCFPSTSFPLAEFSACRCPTQMQGGQGNVVFVVPRRGKQCKAAYWTQRYCVYHSCLNYVPEIIDSNIVCSFSIIIFPFFLTILSHFYFQDSLLGPHDLVFSVILALIKSSSHLSLWSASGILFISPASAAAVSASIPTIHTSVLTCWRVFPNAYPAHPSRWLRGSHTEHVPR